MTVRASRSKPQTKSAPKTLTDLPVLAFTEQKDWEAWLDKNHRSSSGVWLRLAKKASGTLSISYAEALEGALCYGWIDGQKRGEGANTWLQKFTVRSKKSIWSKINRQKALALIEAGRMKPSGLQEIERAKADGRWDSAYDSPSTATPPPDFQAALDRNTRAKAFFSTLDSQNRYAVLFRIHTAKKPETRARRIQQFVEMLGKKQKLHP
jgi:uncharacterized protein YdeI (YjbR/CyaY-like superfamily)